MNQVWVSFAFALGEIWVESHLLCISGPAEVPVANFGEKDIITEAETKKQRRSSSARKIRRLVPLARSASIPVHCSNRESSRIILEQVFDGGIYQFEWRYC